MKHFSVTTPIYYVNDVPHLGHAYTTVAADALARAHGLMGHTSTFVTGTDEHGLKIERAAKAAGVSPKDFVDGVSPAFANAWKELLCVPNDFVRTTEERHKRVATRLWNACATAGDIYLGSYEGPYCVGCEQYLSGDGLVDGVCPLHRTAPEVVSEPTYLFRLSKYADTLLSLYHREPWRIQPEGRRNEVLAFLEQGLHDLSISRSRVQWGIPVPGDPDHVMYVWFDALANYLTTLEGTSWPPSLHLVGKDIVKFHAIFWPAFLLSAGYTIEQLPKTVFAHGFLTVNGKKMTKSIRETVVPPKKLVDLFGADEVRYYLLREIALGQDGDFNVKNVIGRVRTDLADTVGNLLNRTLPFLVKHFDSKVPEPETYPPLPEQDLAHAITQALHASREAWEQLAPHKALCEGIELARLANRFIDTHAPWKLAKEGNRDELAYVVGEVVIALVAIAQILGPAMPRKAEEILDQIGVSYTHDARGRTVIPDQRLRGQTVHPGKLLFKRWTAEEEARVVAELSQ